MHVSAAAPAAYRCYSTPDGLSLAELERVPGTVRKHGRLAAISLTALNVTEGDPAVSLATAVAVTEAVLNSGG